MVHMGSHANTHICSNQLLPVINACHCDLTLADQREVIGVGRNEQHFWKRTKKYKVKMGRYRAHLHYGNKNIYLTLIKPTNKLWLEVCHDLIENVVTSFF